MPDLLILVTALLLLIFLLASEKQGRTPRGVFIKGSVSVLFVLTALAQPPLHEVDLVSLRSVDAPGHIDQRRRVRALGHQGRHLEGLLMVRNHVLHELGVGRRIAGVGDRDRLLGAQFTRRLAWRTRLDDGRLGQADARSCQQDGTCEGVAKHSREGLRNDFHRLASCLDDPVSIAGCAAEKNLPEPRLSAGQALEEEIRQFLDSSRSLSPLG